MKLTKNITRVMVSAVAILVMVFFLIFIFNSDKRSNKNSAASITENIASNVEAGESAGVPKRLRIPSIAVDATILSVGLASDGSMDTPKEASEVAWFNLGAKAGYSGSAVIVGHYGTWKNGSKSVFDNLHELKKGDKIYVEDDKGATVSFVVRESRSYDPAEDAVDVFSSDDERSHLNLITCEGIWNKEAKSFNKRLVVFTDKE